MRYRQLNESLMQQQQQQTSSSGTQELSSLAPQVLSQVKKTLVRKLGVDTTSSVLGSSLSQDNTSEDGKSKNEGKYVSK